MRMVTSSFVVLSLASLTALLLRVTTILGPHNCLKLGQYVSTGSCICPYISNFLSGSSWFLVGISAGWSWVCETVLCWRVINTGAIKPEEVTVHWSSTQGTRRTIWCTCPPTPVCYPLIRNLKCSMINPTKDTQNMNKKRFYTHGWLF